MQSLSMVIICDEFLLCMKDSIPFATANGNGRQEEKEDEHVKENDAQEALETKNLDEAQNQQDEAQHQQDEHKVNYEQPSADKEEIGGSRELSVENCVLDKSAGDTNEKIHLPSDEGSQQSSLNNAQQGDDVSVKEQHPTSRKMEVPNNKVSLSITLFKIWFGL